MPCLIETSGFSKELSCNKRYVGLCTINPADGHRLEDGKKQQAGPAAGVVIIDLKHVDTTLHRGKSHFYPISELREEIWPNAFISLSVHLPVWPLPVLPGSRQCRQRAAAAPCGSPVGSSGGRGQSLTSSATPDSQTGWRTWDCSQVINAVRAIYESRVSVGACVYLCVQAQHDDHDEEADSPELWGRHHGYSSGEGDEGEPRACQSTPWTVSLCTHPQTWPEYHVNVRNLIRSKRMKMNVQ